MKVDFHREDDHLWHRQRDVEAVPAVGQRVVWHKSSASFHFEVVSVTHVFEDRPWYKEHKDIGGDRVCVTLKSVPGPQVDLEAWIKSRDRVQAARPKE